MLILVDNDNCLCRERFPQVVEYSKDFMYINILVFITFLILGTKYMISNLKKARLFTVQGQNPFEEEKARQQEHLIAGSNEILFTCDWFRKQRELYAHAQCIFSYPPFLFSGT